MEKKLNVKYQKIIGTPVFPPGIFCGEAVFEREDEKARTHRGKLFALLSIAGSKNFDAVISSKIILDCLEEEYFRDTEGSPLTALERAAVSASHRFIDLTLGGSGSTEFHLALTVSWGRVLYLSKVGPACIYLLRGGIVKEITMGEEAHVATASGLVNEGDVLILGTRGFKENFPPEKILSLLPNLEEEVAEVRDKGVVCALLIKFDVSESPSKNEVIKFASGRNYLNRTVVPLLRAVGGFLSDIVSMTGRLLPSPRRREVFLRQRHDSVRAASPARLRFVILVCALLFVASVFVTLRRQAQRQLSVESQRILTEAKERITSASDLIDLNNSRAKTLLDEALGGLSKAEGLGKKTEGVNELRQRAKQLLSVVTKEKVVTPKMLYDFSLQDRGSSPSSLTLLSSGEDILVFVSDKASSDVYRLTVREDGASIERMERGSLREPLFLTAYNNVVFVVSKSGIYSGDSKDLSIKEILPPLEDLPKLQDFKSYLGNLYFLFSFPSGISKSFVLEGGEYSKPAVWLKEERDLTRAVSLAVDGSVYVLENTGRILKFEAGKAVDFNLSGYDEVISSSASIYTDSLTENLYVLEPKASKTLVFSKEGGYQGRYSFEILSLDSDSRLIVDGPAKKAYLLAHLQLFQFDL